MTKEDPRGEPDYEGLAAMRFAMRQFLAFSEGRAKTAGLSAAQHQALLAIRGGIPGRQSITIGELAEQLMLRHHSAVGLAARMVDAGLVHRERSSEDRRRIYLSLTAQGERLLDDITHGNLAELRRASKTFLKFFRRFEAEL